jgi:hypothetical protein
MNITTLRADLPEGRSGAWAVEKFSVTEDDIKIHNLRCMFQPGMGGRGLTPGNYTKLTRHGNIIMSDTPAEMRDLWPLYSPARGFVLINGLGLGMAVKAVLSKPEVEHVTVIERSPDVLALVAPHYRSKRCDIIEADAFAWQPSKGSRYSAVWHDIWDDICTDNLEGMKRLHRKYGRRADWQGSWCRHLCEMYR